MKPVDARGRRGSPVLAMRTDAAPQSLAPWLQRAGGLDDLLTEGGDERIAIEAPTGLNRYGCAASPQEAAAEFGSSTASVISPSAHAAVLALAERLGGYPSPEAAYATEVQRIRRRLAELCGLPEAAAGDMVLGASGTDLHLIAAELARGGEGALTCILPDPAETGRGVANAVRSLRFADQSPHGAQACAGEPLDGVTPGRIIATPLRDAEGLPRSSGAVDTDVERACDAALKSDGRALLVIVDVSKTGLAAPTAACASRLKQRFGEALTVLVDACQFRICNQTLGAYLAQDFLVALTGSKFVGGPAFSGALLIPGPSAGRLRLRPLPSALSDISGREDWPAGYRGREDLADLANIGLLLRWEAALHELAAFRALDPQAVAAFVTAFAARIEAALDTSPGLDRLPVPDLARAPPAQWDQSPTIFPFLVLAEGRPVAPHRLLAIYRRLQCPAPGDRAAPDAIHLGQPVAVGYRDGQALSALRLSLSARLIVEALATPEGPERVVARAIDALAAVEALASAV